jgi:hypothetical protein
MDIAHQLVVIFCELDDFCKELDMYAKDYLLEGPTKKGARGPMCKLAMSEIMTILVMFQIIRFRDFKTFYCGFLQVYWRSYFVCLPTYHRFVEIMQRATFPMALFAQLKSGKRTGIYYVDSSGLPVCHLKRQKRHKTFQALAQFGRSSFGWFFGLKLHIVINNKGELVAFKITPGNHSDLKAAEPLFKTLRGLAFGDKGYISKKLFALLLGKGLKLITRSRRNMKNVLPITPYEKQLLHQRNVVETVIGHLKQHYQVWHTRHRSVMNAMTHLLSALAAYAIEPLRLSTIKLIMKTPN